MKRFTIYFMALFLIACGSFFGYYMQNRRKTQQKSQEMVPIVVYAHEETKPQETTVFTVTTKKEQPCFTVRSVGENIVIYDIRQKEIYRAAFTPARLRDTERERLKTGIHAETQEEALMILESYIN